MSDNSTGTSGSGTDAHEPSMEDILASIRKMIAEDEAPQTESKNIDVTLDDEGLDLVTTPDTSDPPESAPETDMSVADLVQSVAAPVSTSPETVESAAIDDTLDLTIDTADFDVMSLDSDVSANPKSDLDAQLADMLDVDMDEGDLDISIPEAEETTPADVSELAETAVELDETDTEVDPELMALVNFEDDDVAEEEIITDTSPVTDSDTPMETEGAFGSIEANIEALESEDDAVPEPDFVTDPAADLIAEEVDVFEAEETDAQLATPDLPETAATGDADMDLVKSLMADLTDDSFLEDDGVIEPEVPQDKTADLDYNGADSDVMDDILSMTLDDEVRLQEEQNIKAGLAAGDIAPETIETIEEPNSDSDADVGISSLMDVARRAAADADLAPVALASGAVVAAATASVSAETDSDEDVLVDELEAIMAVKNIAEDDDFEQAVDVTVDSHEVLPEIETKDSVDDLPPAERSAMKEEPPMPKAVQTDKFLDEVTETAAAGAFASLNQVVEEKAVTAERGDRIGDLVMEALQPMLKEWLDANLKGIVERAVTKEVKRISSGK